MAELPLARRMWGHSEHSLDDKFRVIVPIKFREALGEEFVLTIGPGHHLRVYPMDFWRELEEILLSDDAYDELDDELSFLQRMFGACEFASADQQHRLSIPRHMRDWAGLDDGGPAIILGVGKRLEIWSRVNYRDYVNGYDEKATTRAMAKRRANLQASSREETAA